MENRQKKMDDFLKFVSAIYSQEPRPSIYGTLVRYKARVMSDENKPISKFFSNWIERFQTNQDIDVFVHEKWPYFCQFINGDPRDFAEDAIKIYIPIDLAHIEIGANKIFDFLASNKYKHSSKIGSDERTDNIVIRVENEYVANEISHFVKSDDDIKKGLMSLNPFCFSDGNIGFVADSNLSYNDVLASYIDDYMSFYHGTPEVSIEHFRSFVSSKYNEHFVTGQNLDVVLKSKSDNFKWDEASYLVNYQQITELILISTDSNSNTHSLQEHLNSLREELNTNQKYNKFKNLQNPNQIDNEPNQTDNEPTNSDLLVLREIINTNVDKYGVEWICKALQQYLDNGNVLGFTRDNDSRDKISQFKSTNVSYLIQAFLGPGFNQNNFIEDFVNKLIARDYFQEACMETYNKYGKDQAKEAIIRYMRDNNPKYFTNDNLARDNLTNANLTKDSTLKFLMLNGIKVDNNYSINEVADQYIDLIASEQMVEAQVR